MAAPSGAPAAGPGCSATCAATNSRCQATAAAGFRRRCTWVGTAASTPSPRRSGILEELDADDCAEIAAAAKFDGDRLTPAALAFGQAGTALGRGVVALVTLNSPGRLVLMLLAEIGRPSVVSAASLYLQAVETELDAGFGTSSVDARGGGSRLEVALLGDAHDQDGATAAAPCVHALIDHARDRNSCESTS